MVLELGFPIEIICTKIVQKLRKGFLTIWLKIAQNFDIISHWCAKAIPRKFWKKSWFAYFVIFCYFVKFRDTMKCMNPMLNQSEPLIVLWPTSAPGEPHVWVFRSSDWYWLSEYQPSVSLRQFGSADGNR